MNKNDEMIIIIYSCAKNSDMWSVFTELFRKFWPDCIFRLVLATDFFVPNKADFDDIVIYDGNWYQMIMAAIDKYETPYVMLWMDDYLLYDYVENESIDGKLLMMKKYHAANIRLFHSNVSRSEIFEKDNDFSVIKQGTAYALSTHVGIWDVQFLKKYVSSEWSPWDFERIGSFFICAPEYVILESRKYAFPYEEGVRNGKWLDTGIKICKKNDIIIDLKKRKKMNIIQKFWIRIKTVLLLWNPDLVVRLQNSVLSKKNG